MHNGKRVSVGIIAYNEEQAIGKVLEDFRKEPVIDEIIVVDNNSADRTAAIAENLGAKVVKETQQGYGYACRRALRECTGDFIFLTEGDASFSARDVNKFISYAEDADMVLGTRTCKTLLEKGAKMQPLLFFGNIFLAKLIQLKFLREWTRLTDVGCTFRLIKKESFEKIEKEFTVGGSEFSPEMIIVALRNNLKIVEIPINYGVRIGESKITSDSIKSIKLGLRMIKLIVIR